MDNDISRKEVDQGQGERKEIRVWCDGCYDMVNGMFFLVCLLIQSLIVITRIQINSRDTLVEALID